MAERIPIAFLAGFVSVIAPCVLPLVPGYLATISNVEASRLGDAGVARRVVRASVPFILGFTIVFVALGAAFVLAGVAFARAIAAFRWLRDHYRAIEVASGVTLLVLGLLLFFDRDWWLRVLLNRALAKIGLDSL